MGLAGLASDLTLPRYVSVCVRCVCLLVSAIRAATIHADSNAGLAWAGNLFCTPRRHPPPSPRNSLSLEFEPFVTKCTFVKKILTTVRYACFLGYLLQGFFGKVFILVKKGSREIMIPFLIFF